MRHIGMVRRGAIALAAALLALTGTIVIPVAMAGAEDGANASQVGTPDGSAIAAERVAEAHAADRGAPDATAVENPDVTAQAILTVSTTADGGAGSLREAVETLAVNAGGDTVVLEAGATYVLTCAGGGDLDHGNTPLTIEGNGATITMAAGCNERILENGTGALLLDNVQFNNVVTSRVGAYYGGLVLTNGDLTLTGVVAAGNSITNTQDTDLFSMDGGSSTTAIITDTFLGANTIAAGSGGGCGVFCTWDVTVTRVWVDGTTLTGNGTCGIFCSSDVTFVDSHVTNTTVTDSSNGGDCGIFCSSDVVMTGSSVADFTASVTGGGGSCGVFCSSHVTMTNSSVTRSNLTAGNYVCGIFCNRDVTMTNSSVDLTTLTATGDNGCGIFCSNNVIVTNSSVTRTRLSSAENCGLILCGDNATITNSTIADNIDTSGGDSSGAFDGLDVTFAYVTFVGNQTAGRPALDEIDSFATFGSVLTGSGAGGNCGAGFTVTSYGDNYADDTTCGLAATGDRQVPGGDPMLQALADNGGPGPTMLPAQGSPLIDAVPAARCQTPPLATGITTDERSLPRPSVLSPDCEVGAVELQPVPVIEPTFTG